MRLNVFRAAVLAVPLAIMAAGCAPIRARQGYVFDTELTAGVEPGVDNRDSVLRTMGRPTFQSQFGPEQWYYIARTTSQVAFRVPRPTGQNNLRISFAPDGTVTAVDRTDLSQVASISPSSKETPTLGRERSFFEEFFGGIGSVGAATGTGPGGGTGAP